MTFCGALPGGAQAEALARVFVAVLPGFLLQLALFGSHAVEGVPGAVKALWPA